MLNYLKLIRVNQWVKNLFVFLPIFFSGNLLNTNLFIESFYGFLIFSFVASSIYIINDYVVIARTIGINIPTYNKGAFIEFGEKHEVLSSDGTVLFDIKFHKKGTYHIRLNQEFCLRLNIAIGRLFGWLHTADDLSELGEDIDPTHWNSLQHITPKTLALTFNGAVSDTEGDDGVDDAEKSAA